MNYVIKTRNLLQLTDTQFADLVGITYSEMADILEQKIQPSAKLLKSCRIAREIFLNKNNTLCVKANKRRAM